MGEQLNLLKDYPRLKIAIIAIVLLLIIGGTSALILYEQYSFERAYVGASNQVHACLSQSLENALINLGVFAGSDQITEHAFHTGSFSANYLYQGNTYLVPTTRELEGSIERLMTRDFESCLSGASLTEVSLREDPTVIRVLIDDTVHATLASQITIQSLLFGRAYDLTTVRSSTNLPAILSPVSEIVSSIAQTRGVISPLALRYPGYDLTFNTYPDQNTVIFLLKDNQAQNQLAWLFAVDVS